MIIIFNFKPLQVSGEPSLSLTNTLTIDPSNSNSNNNNSTMAKDNNLSQTPPIIVIPEDDWIKVIQSLVFLPIFGYDAIYLK